MTESYRYELAGTGVEMVLVQPGGFPTDFGSRMVYPQDQERVASYGELADTPEQLAMEGLAYLKRVHAEAA